MSVDASEDGLAIAVHRTTFTLFDDQCTYEFNDAARYPTGSKPLP